MNILFLVCVSCLAHRHIVIAGCIREFCCNRQVYCIYVKSGLITGARITNAPPSPPPPPSVIPIDLSMGSLCW